MKMKPLDKTIKIYDGWMSEKDCKMFVQIYKNLQKGGYTGKRRNFDTTIKESIAEDEQVALHEAIYEHGDHEIPEGTTISNTFIRSYFAGPHLDYLKDFSILKSHDFHTIKYLKIQKTLPGQGYHSWHCEDGSKKWDKRLFAFTLYLNDVQEGGETEFLYLSKRIEAKRGRLAIFPASFEYTHRGNPPISNEKYILTGWVEFG